MSKIALTPNASGSGTFTIAAPNSDTDRTLTLPDEAGTVLTSGGAIDVNASAPADSLAINASGNVGIGDSTPTAATGTARFLKIGNSSTSNCGLILEDETNEWELQCNDSLTVFVNDTYKARFNTGTGLLVGTTNNSPAESSSETGIRLGYSGGAHFSKADTEVAIFNRNTSNGVIVEFRQAGTQQGTISVSGTTVSYNGGHLARWSQLADNTRDESIVKGTVMSNLDQMAEWTHEGVTEENEQLNCMKVSDVEADVDVAGVFVNWDNDDDIYTNDMNIAMTGDMVIRIASGTTVARGDLLMSAGDGTAKPQGDDIVRSKTIAKVTSTHVSHTYDDGSYLVPCVLMAC